MKYKKGSIVEVLIKDEFSYNCWQCAQIVSGNEHNYTVSYNAYPGFTNEDDVGGISRKSIRPCPPMLEISECWVPGDAAEVFHNLSWKMAIVLKDCGWDQFLVRVIGSFQEFEVTKSELRVRQSYQNGEWVVIGNVSRDYISANCTKLLKYDRDSGCLTKENAAIIDFYLKDVCFDTRNNHHMMGSGIVSSKTGKRASTCCYSKGEAKEERPMKFRVSGKEGRRLRVPGTSLEKIDHVANNGDMENKNGTYRSESSCALTLEVYDTNSVVSSTGSCSINSYKPYDMYCGSGNDSDAESTCRLGYLEDTDQSHSNKTSDERHILDLHVYQSTLEALHAAGPLTWENETMGQSTGLYTLLLHQ